MKTNKFLTLLLALVASIAITSCVEDDDFSIPSDLGEEENIALQNILAGIADGTIDEVSIAELKAMYDSDPNNDGDNDDAIPFQVDTDIVVKGYVSSSDRTGNFYKEIYIQDNFENPTAAIKVIINQTDLYNKYNKGREVYIRLNPPTNSNIPNGLFIGEERTGNNVITIGGGTETDQFGTTVTSLGTAQANSRMFRSTTTMDIVPLNISFDQISDDNIGMFVQIDGVEFPDYLSNENYFDPQEDFDTQRTLQACSGFSYSNFILETSSFSDFKNESLPTGNGSISAIVSKTFDASSLILTLNSTDDVNFDGERCSLLDITDFSEVFNDDFESMSTNATISGNGWTAFAEEGTYNWRALTTTDSGNPGPGNKIASMGAYNSGVTSNITWLISPSIDLDAQDLEFVNFQTSNSFSDDSELELLISTDWDGIEANITSATWTTLPGIIVSDDAYYQDWVDSGLINIGSYSGTAHIAFKYIGGDNSGNNPPNTGTIDGTYEIDNFKVLVQD
ncbi:DUF5689 domain-containing protein [Ichthyenterobacterium magnum]|uniref:DUF5689 domain-containing protein n=1 Tax=Ichthyenterobacterium magnum TaxID=1230530 RepID=A0A420DWT9_9FLAO|nr:DUF5689 domain-containing protein [Ichthyenterobacterium magnum]RKE98673.1 hypothetical protein BXY80_0766 [Ichthyenterobacterium magnum]